MLHTEPSFCIYNSEDGVENQDLVRSVTIGDNISALGNTSDFSFDKKDMGLIEETENELDEENESVGAMYLASGFGVDGNAVNGGGVEFAPLEFDEHGDAEGYYKRVLKEDPSNSLFLKNYAQLLLSKGDLSAAEHYYFQATLADPKDGDTLSQYAKLVWELHQDKDRASDYFERAVHAAPENRLYLETCTFSSNERMNIWFGNCACEANTLCLKSISVSSHVLAAYASFLWDINDDESEDENTLSDLTKIEIAVDATASQNLDYDEDNRPVSPSLHLAAGLGIGDNTFCGSPPVDYTAAISDMDENAEEYYVRMIIENPHNPLLLRNYAQFLCRSKGDLVGAEEYYSRAILADPTDGETISQYAILIWQLHRDKYKASSYFKRAVQASPEDSDVLAAYARFLWETEEDEGEDEEDEDETLGDRNVAPLLQGVVAANA